MSTTSPQNAAAGDQAFWQAQLAQQLSGVAAPELKNLTGQLSGMLGGMDATGKMQADVGIQNAAAGQLNRSYAQAKRGSAEAISYGGLRSGMGDPTGAGNSSMMSAATSLDRDRTSALNNLNFMSAQSSMQDYNQVLQLLGQGTKTSLGLAQGFSGAAGSAIGGLSTGTQMGGILGGAGAGAGLGMTVGGPWGAAIGGVVGGVAGGLTSP
jgi:hypothetical protein